MFQILVPLKKSIYRTKNAGWRDLFWISFEEDSDMVLRHDPVEQKIFPPIWQTNSDRDLEMISIYDEDTMACN